MRFVEPSKVAAIAYILVGGASSRFGRDKALVEFDGKTMLERMRGLLAGICVSDIYLVGDPAKYAVWTPEIPCVPDKWPGEGPLGGILTALLHTQTCRRTRIACAGVPVDLKATHNLILSCDMPFLNKEWMEEFFHRSLRSAADVVVPSSENGLEPMCACWRTSARPVIQEQFKHGVRKVTEVFKHLNTEVLDESVWKRFDTKNRLFWNMNTPADYEEARRIMEMPQA